MAVKTTKIQCNQDVDVRGKVDIEGKVTCGGDAEVDGVASFVGGGIDIGSDLKSNYGAGIYKFNAEDLFTGFAIGQGQVEDTNVVTFYGMCFAGDSREGCKIGEFLYNTKTHTYNASNAINLMSLKELTKKEQLFRHFLTLKASTNTAYVDYYSRSNLVVDSIQDLTSLTGGHSFGGGDFPVKYTNGVWSISGGDNVTSVTDEVTLVTYAN